MLKHSLALLAVAGASLILYNGHAGLGSNVQDGTSNTLQVGEVAGSGPGLVLMPDMGGQFRNG
jgi:hypothetical protein